MTTSAPMHGSVRATSAPSTVASPEDVAFCRAMLPRVSRTFALNIRLLGGSMREAVSIGYLWCRAADTLEDAWPGDRVDIERRFKLLREAIAGDERSARALAMEAESAPNKDATSEMMVGLPRVWRCWRALEEMDRTDVAECVGIMAAGMSRYAGRMADRAKAEGVESKAPPTAGAPRFSYIESEDELHDYCWIVAGCVGVMLTRLFARRAGLAQRDAETLLRLSPAVGEGLQLTNILLDWPQDIRSGRCHVPATWLAEYGLSPGDLVGSPLVPVFTLKGRLESLARAALEQVPEYLAAIPTRHFRYRQFCAWPALWALASLRHTSDIREFPYGPKRPRLSRTKLWGVALGAVTRAHGSFLTRQLFEQAAAFTY